MEIPPEVIEIRREICAREKCDLDLNFADPCAACGNGHWGRYAGQGCDDPNRIVAASSTAENGGFSHETRKPSATINKPGHVLAYAIRAITGATPCGACSARVAQMNEWGYIGCWRNRKTIIRWLSDEASNRGHPSTDKELGTVFRAAMREALRSR